MAYQENKVPYNRERVEIHNAFILESWWCKAENTVMCNMKCMYCKTDYTNVDVKDHFIQCKGCGRVLKI